MPAYSSKRVVFSRGSAEALGGDRLPVCTGHPQNCRTNPSSEAILPSSQTYQSTPSYRPAAPSPPRGAPGTASCMSLGASPWASLGKAPSCSRCRPGASLSSGLGVERGTSCCPAGSDRQGRSSGGTGSSAPARKEPQPSGRIPLQDRLTRASLPRSEEHTSELQSRQYLV